MKGAEDELWCQKIAQIIEDLRRKGSIIVAFSGGIDSLVVAALAFRALGHRSLAATINSPLLPSGELGDARRMAEQIGVNHLVLKLNELRIPGFRDNPPHRCYLCKKFRFGKLKEMAIERDYKTIADGTNLSDLGEYRPGLKAVEELGVYSPLLEAGLCKEDTRRIAKLLNIPKTNKPASACLASRVPYSGELTPARLKRIDYAESWVRRITGADVIRVRDYDELARIEVGPSERNLFFNEETLSRVAQELKKLGYEFVTLDIEGYRYGSFDWKLHKLGETSVHPTCGTKILEIGKSQGHNHKNKHRTEEVQ